jgi:hypothetical protein
LATRLILVQKSPSSSLGRSTKKENLVNKPGSLFVFFRKSLITFLITALPFTKHHHQQEFQVAESSFESSAEIISSRTANPEAFQ